MRVALLLLVLLPAGPAAAQGERGELPEPGLPEPGSPSGPADVRPEPALLLTLDEAIGRALVASPLVADLRGDLELAALELQRAQSAYKTKAYLFGNSDARVGADVGASLRAGVTRRMLGGSRWSMGVNQASFGDSYLSEVNVGYTLPLFQNPLSNGRFALDEAEIGYRQRQGQTKLGIEELVLEVVNAYYALALAGTDIQVAEGATALAERLERATTIRVRSGQSSQLDLQLARLRVAQNRQRRQAAVAAEANAANRLRLVLGIPFDQALMVDDEIPLPVGAGTSLLTTASLEALALERREELLSLREQVTLAQRKVAEKGSRFPSMDVTVQYALVGEGSSFSESSNLNDSRLGIGVAFDMTSQGELVTEQRRLYLRFQASARALDRLEGEIRSEVQAALYELRDAEAQLALTRQDRGLAQQQLRLAEILYTKGTATTEEMLERQQSLSDARQQELAARVRLLLASYRLERATGSLLERWKD